MKTEGDLAVEQQPFLEGQEYVGRGDTRSNRPASTVWLRRCAIDLVIIVCLSVLLSTIVLVRYHDIGISNHAIPGLLVKEKSRAFTSMYDTVWFNDPNSAWRALQADRYIRISTTELHSQEDQPDSMTLPDGGHLAWLGVFHDLHCIDHVRKTIHGDTDKHVGDNATQATNAEHVEHCIDHLRQLVMCRPDVETINVFGWNGQLPVFENYRPHRQCVDWELLMSSLSDRTVSNEELERKKTMPVDGA